MSDEELYAFAKDLQAPFHLLKEVARLKRLPVVSFAAGGIATPGAYPLVRGWTCHFVFVSPTRSHSHTPLILSFTFRL